MHHSGCVCTIHYAMQITEGIKLKKKKKDNWGTAIWFVTRFSLLLLWWGKQVEWDVTTNFQFYFFTPFRQVEAVEHIIAVQRRFKNICSRINFSAQGAQDHLNLWLSYLPNRVRIRPAPSLHVHCS